MLSEGDTGLDAKDLDRFSRQNAALGAETTAKLIKMKVVVAGLRGVGIETCKNLMLQGVGELTLVDSSPAAISDVGVNFFITEADATSGLARSEVVAPRLAELNPVCKVSTAPALTDAVILAHRAVVITDKSLSLPELVRINALCRSNGISFLYNFCGGVSTSTFVDHGADHVVNDPDGEKPVTKLVQSITPVEGSPDEVLIRYDTPEGQLPTTLDGGHFELTDVTGLGLDNEIMVLEVSHPWKDPAKTIRAKFATEGKPAYSTGGLLTEKKMPKASPMVSLEDKIRNPGNPFMGDMVLTNLIDMGAELQQHVALVASLAFLEKNGALPACRSDDDVASTLTMAKELLAAGTVEIPDFEIDEVLFSTFVRFCAVELQPMAAFTGGVLAQEVVKCTGKFTPIPGWLHFACKDALPSEKAAAEDMDLIEVEDASVTNPDYTPRGSRYDELASVYGWAFVEKLGALNYFMVGCGALGCEFLKNFALNGICCGESGSLVVTDADRIELSNLSRQFLFREHNVGQPKSRAAGVMAAQMNSGLTVKALEMFVGPKTEDSFDDEFWMGLDGVCNALDNMEARLYVDNQCVRYEKTLLESGTMGTSGNTDTIAPFKTRTYAAGGAAAQGGGVPMCTLRNFPHLTDHCIEWARDQFELFFVKLPKSVERYMEEPEAFASEKRRLAESEPGQAIFEARCVQSLLAAAKTPSETSAAQVAFDLFHFLFRDKIVDLQTAFPQDSRIVDRETGADKGPFWGEKKRYPTAACFDPQDEAHLGFMSAATCLFGTALGVYPVKAEGDDTYLSACREDAWVQGIAKTLVVPEYIGAPVNTDGDDSGASAEPVDDRTVVLDGILDNLSSMKDAIAAGSMPPMETADFEKDDDFNFHIAFITAATNMRCDNYSIKRAGFQGVKIVAGKIIAAIATTTAAVCGLVMLELFKLAMDADTDSLMSRMIGLAVNTYTTFSQDPSRPFESKTTVEPPAGDVVLPDDAYDDKGKVKEEFMVKTEVKVYPEKFTVWDKMPVSGALTLKGFGDFLRDEHGLVLKSWSMVVGSLDQRPVTCNVYPPKVPLDYSLLPALDLTMPQATMAIMKTPTAKPTQAYIMAWKTAKAAGAVPAVEAIDPDAVTLDTTLAEILAKMASVGEAYAAEGKVDTVNLSHLGSRKFWVIPGPEGPNVTLAECGSKVDHLTAIKIELA